MALTLAQAKKSLGEKAFKQIQKQIKSTRPGKNTAAANLKKINPAEEALYVLLKEVFEPEYPIEREVCLCKSVDRLWRSDFVIESLKVSIELDGWESHGKLHNFKNDRDKDFEILMQGYERIRIYASQALKSPGLVKEKLERVKPVLIKRVGGINHESEKICS
ncbi:hypothetical protein JCM30760_26680 [Thiomicrorhabdus hydrogeniphila]